ncbi:hypothetical protein BD408DRAFT_423260 [Parasitella parasitica]|nr:hypothetical protein BD408DRAFT_423260 [Parasitella parasitica]
MITYFIINKLGTVVYQSTNTKKLANNTTTNESQRIRYLPLLVINDLIKANLSDVIQYVKVGNKTAAFKEQQNLLYIACTMRQNIPISLLQLHLKVMHSFIKFHYGPHWSLHLQGGSNNNRNSNIKLLSPSDLNACLSQLPFLCGKLSIKSCDSLCLSEQVQVSDDLRLRLMENMTQCCNTAFVHQFTNQHHHGNHHRNSFFSSASSRATNIFDHHHHHHHSQDSSTLSTLTWNYCFLFVREKLVTQCHNKGNTDNNDLPDEFVYFLKLLVSQFMQEKHESGHYYLENIKTTTSPQNISNSSTADATVVTDFNTITTNNNPNKILNSTTAASSSSLKSETSTSNTTNSSSQPSSLAYVYVATSSSAPFKIREKSTSSVTVVSSDSSVSYWSNPLSNSSLQAHHLVAPMKAMEIDRTPANVLQPQHHNHQLQQSMIADILNGDENNNNLSFLSSSVPSESTTATSNTIATTYSHPMDSFQGVSSAPSSPTHRSRSQSISTTGGEDFSLKHLLTNLINGETNYLDQTEDVKLVRRWVKLDGHIYLANFLLVSISDGLCAIVVCKDDPDKMNTSNSRLPQAITRSNWRPTSLQVKRFKTTLRSCLSDFTTFLLTKEVTHFTNLSFAVTYPGLVHFVHFDKGIMTAPRLVDLNDLDKNHELLHEVYEKYNASIADRCKWVWPNEPTLKKLCNEMIHLGLCYRQDPHKSQALQESNDHEYYFLYQKIKHQELLAIYFSIIPPNRLWSMHQKLLNDIGQRVHII